MSRASRSVVLAFAMLGATCLASLSSVAPSHAAQPNDPAARAELLSTQASEAFDEGRFHDAIKLYLDAFDISKSPETLYNVGFIYEKKLTEPELAIDYYQRVVSAEGVEAALKAKALKRMTALKDARPKKEPDPKKKDPETPSTGPGAGPYILFAAGGASLATGLTFAILATVTHGDFAKADSADDKRSLQQKGKTQALVADLTLSVGGAAVVGGLIWLLVAGGGDEPAKTVGFPVGGPGGVTLDAQMLPEGGAMFVLGGHL